MVQAKTTNQQKAADPKYRVRKDGYEWIFRPRELIIKSMTNGDIAYRSCYPIDFYWVQNSCQEKITRSAQPILYGDQKRAQAIPSITSILVKVANNWHPPTAEEIKKQGQKKDKKRKEKDFFESGHRKLFIWGSRTLSVATEGVPIGSFLDA